MPRDVAVARPWASGDEVGRHEFGDIAPPGGRRLATAHSATPATHLLSNGRYAVMLTAAGSGYSRWRDLAVTRWREDATCDDWGSYIFLRDVGSGEVWSAGYQPSGVEPDDYEVAFNEDRAEIHAPRRHRSRRSMEVLVSAEDDAEVRRVSISNSGSRAREIEVTSYAELVLAPPGRRRRASGVFQAVRRDRVSCRMSAPFWRRAGGARRASRKSGPRISPSSTARRSASRSAKPTGRVSSAAAAASANASRGDRRPAALEHGRHGARSDLRPAPTCADRARRDGAHRLLDPGRVLARSAARPHRQAPRRGAFERAATLAWTQAQVQLHHLGIDPGEAGLFQRLAGHLLYPAADAAAVLRHHHSRRRRAVGALAPGHFRRSADPAAAHRRHRGSRISRASCCRRTNTGG